MQTLAWALGLLIAGLCLHLVVWKLALPKNQLAALLKLFMLVLLGWFGVNAVLGLLGGGAFGLPLRPVPCLMVGLFFLATSWAYVVLYSTIDADSPSITILLALHAAGERGLTMQELVGKTGMERFLDSRVERMVRDTLVELTPEGYVVGAKGLGLLRLVRLWRMVMGAPAEVG